MKEGIKSFLVYILISYVVLDLLSLGIKLPGSSLYLFLVLLVLVISILMVCPLLGFLTVKCQFPTFFLMSTILLAGSLYLLKLFMVDFYIEEFMFGSMELGSIYIKEFSVNPLLSIAFASVGISFLAGLYRELDVN